MNGDGATSHQYAAAPNLVTLLCQRDSCRAPSRRKPDVVFAEHTMVALRALAVEMTSPRRLASWKELLGWRLSQTSIAMSASDTTRDALCSACSLRQRSRESMKDRLRAVLGTVDPLRLLDEIRTVQHHLAGLAAGERVHVLPHRHADLDRFMKSLAHTWRDGEVRPTHRSGPKPPRPWRIRSDP